MRIPDVGYGRGARAAWKVLTESAKFVGAVTVLTAAALWLYQQWDERRDWRPVENATIASLRSVGLMEKVRAQLGPPSQRTLTRDGRIGAEYFHRRTYWLQVIYETDTRRVLGWTVTSCARDFAPVFIVGGLRVKLWKTTVSTDLGLLEHKLRFEPAQTVHQPNQLIYGRLPGVLNFVGLVLGVVDVCGDAYPAAQSIIFKATSAISAANEGFTYTEEGVRAVAAALQPARSPRSTCTERSTTAGRWTSCTAH